MGVLVTGSEVAGRDKHPGVWLLLWFVGVVLPVNWLGTLNVGQHGLLLVIHSYYNIRDGVNWLASKHRI